MRRWDSGVHITEYPFSLLSTPEKPINVLFTESAYQFIFYHELAHPIQNQLSSTKLNYEYSIRLKPYELKDHVKEFDADRFAAIRLGQHVVKNASRYPNGRNLKEYLLGLCIIATSSICMYFLSRMVTPKYHQELYLHPNNALRILQVFGYDNKLCTSEIERNWFSRVDGTGYESVQGIKPKKFDDS